MTETLTTLLEREHHRIDAGLEAFVAGPDEADGRAELAGALAALRRHIYLEEEFLFPPLRAAGLLAPVLVMLREHGDIWRSLGLLETLDLGDVAARELVERLLGQLAAHNAKEEPIVYPQGDAVLDDEAQQRLREFIESGSMPAEWTCAQA